MPLVTILGVYFAVDAGRRLRRRDGVRLAGPRPHGGGGGVLARLPVVQAGVLFTSILFVLSNLLVDLSYGLIDPRIRL